MTDLTRHATWREIQAQPAIWRDWRCHLDLTELRQWVVRLGGEEIWLCGAESSGFICPAVSART